MIPDLDGVHIPELTPDLLTGVSDVLTMADGYGIWHARVLFDGSVTEDHHTPDVNRTKYAPLARHMLITKIAQREQKTGETWPDAYHRIAGVTEVSFSHVSRSVPDNTLTSYTYDEVVENTVPTDTGTAPAATVNVISDPDHGKITYTYGEMTVVTDRDDETVSVTDEETGNELTLAADGVKVLHHIFGEIIDRDID